MEHNITSYYKRQRVESFLKNGEFCFPLIAVVLACGISFYSQISIPIEKPVILLLGSFFLLLPFRAESPVVLQKVIGFYLSSIVVNQLSSQYFSISFRSVNLSISYSAVILLLCATGYILGKINSMNMPRGFGETNMVYCWLSVLTIVVIHMVLLTLILSKFYGYGYERNLIVLGNLCLYFLLFVSLWKMLGTRSFKLGIGLVLIIFYLAVIFNG